MAKIGIVLAGGGKGGYEIGVWKYLHEIGLDSHISVISGTSVGGLNAVLFALGDYNLAEKIWLEQIKDKILDTESISHKKGALFSREGLLQIIDSNIDLEKISNSEKSIYVTCYSLDKLTPKYIKLNGKFPKEIKKWLLATSAIPIVFEKEKIQGENYIDGGIKDNVPLKPLIYEGCSDALIINLDKNYHVDYSGFNIQPVVLNPTIDLGSFVTGTIDFSQAGTKQRIEIGYNDCKKYKYLLLKSLLKRIKEGEKKVTEEEAMKKTEEINSMNDKAILKETLKKISQDEELANHIKGRMNMNLEIGTAGGKVFWRELAEFGGWVWQQNNIFKQVRLLDPEKNRKAWGNYDKIISVCKDFLMHEIRKEFESSQKYEKS